MFKSTLFQGTFEKEASLIAEQVQLLWSVWVYWSAKPELQAAAFWVSCIDKAALMYLNRSDTVETVLSLSRHFSCHGSLEKYIKLILSIIRGTRRHRKIWTCSLFTVFLFESVVIWSTQKQNQIWESCFNKVTQPNAAFLFLETTHTQMSVLQKLWTYSAIQKQRST